jgi:hypothetical protein
MPMYRVVLVVDGGSVSFKWPGPGAYIRGMEDATGS